MKHFFTLFLFLTTLFNAQTFDILSLKLSPYEGGPEQFYKDLNDVLVKNNFKHCNNRFSEMYLAKLEIDNNNNAVLLDINNNEKNDCAKDLFLSALIEINKMKKWKKISEIQNRFSIIFYPIDFFENYKEGYTTKSLSKDAEFPGGIAEFRNQISKNFIFPSNNNSKGVFQYKVTFKIDTNGNIIDLNVFSEKKNEEIEKNIFSAINNINQKWIPATFRGNPIISKFQIPLNFTIE